LPELPAVLAQEVSRAEPSFVRRAHSTHHDRVSPPGSVAGTKIAVQLTRKRTVDRLGVDPVGRQPPSDRYRSLKWPRKN
jgi:hypothetical protein